MERSSILQMKNYLSHMEIARTNIKEEKAKIREKIWSLMEDEGIAVFPLPCRGRIPNFVGAPEACEKIQELEEFQSAEVIKANPDSPQRRAREMALMAGKTLIMATPRLKARFLLLKDLQNFAHEASSIRGAFKFGKKIDWEELPEVDLIINGSVAVAPDGARLGKGHGYGDIEYAILRELQKIKANAPRVTIVHERQIVEVIPMERQDMPVDVIITPERMIRTDTKYEGPEGIFWELVDEKTLEDIPLLKELKKH